MLCSHPCLTSGNTLDDSLVPQFTPQDKPGALSHSSDKRYMTLVYLCQEASLGIQATLQSDPFNQGPGTHSTCHKAPFQVPG